MAIPTSSASMGPLLTSTECAAQHLTLSETRFEDVALATQVLCRQVALGALTSLELSFETLQRTPTTGSDALAELGHLFDVMEGIPGEFSDISNV